MRLTTSVYNILKVTPMIGFQCIHYSYHTTINNTLYEHVYTCVCRYMYQL